MAFYDDSSTSDDNDQSDTLAHISLRAWNQTPRGYRKQKQVTESHSSPGSPRSLSPFSRSSSAKSLPDLFPEEKSYRGSPLTEMTRMLKRRNKGQPDSKTIRRQMSDSESPTEVNKLARHQDVTEVLQAGMGRKSLHIPCCSCEPGSAVEDSECFCIDCNAFFCGRCIRVHNRMKESKFHTVLNKEQMPNKPLQCMDERFCSNHDDKQIEFYCKNDGRYLCAVCTTLEHKKCELDSIQDIAKEFTDSGEYDRIVSRVEKFTSTTKDKIDFLEKTSCMASKSIENVSSVIDNLKRRFDKKLYDTKIKLKCEARKIKEANVCGLESAKGSCLSIVEKQDERLTAVKELQRFGQKELLAITSFRTNERLVESEFRVNRILRNCQVSSFCLRVNDALNTLLESSDNLAKLEIKTENVENMHEKERIRRKELAETGNDFC